MAKEPRSLAGKVVAITGGGRGIGRQTAAALIEQGAKVAVGDIDQALAATTAAELGHGTVGLGLDVTSTGSFDAFLTAVEQQLGPLDVLINNAGIMPLGPFAQEHEAVSRQLVEVNLHGVIIGTKLALARFQPRDTGTIVNIASMAGKIGFPGGATYSATKHAVVGLTEAVRGELRGSGVQALLIMPTVVNTELGAGLAKMRLFGNVEPTDVAQTIVTALQTERFDNYVPAILGPVTAFGRIFPRRLSEFVLRLLRVNKVLWTTDPVVRAAYEARILPQGTPPTTPQSAPTSTKRSVADVAASVASHIDR